MRAHFIGICGVGMSATALLLKDLGWTITGSDEGVYPPASDYLAKGGITFSIGYSPENIPPETEVFVVGKNAKLAPDSNVEVQAAIATGKPMRSFADILGELSNTKETTVVVGSYGKSTTTALISWCLLHAGKDPSFFIGAIPIGMERTSHMGATDTFIIEGDEYPASHTDPRSKFLLYHAHNVVLTSAVHDHINVFPTHEAYLTPFKELIQSLPSDGLLVAMGDDPIIQDLASLHKGPVVTYSVSDPSATWYADNTTFGEETSFDLMHNKEKVCTLSTKLLGKHNVENIVGASAFLLEKNLLTPEELQEGMRTFQGVVRRLDRKDTHSQIPVYEGFGSSYEKARSAISAVKLHFPSKRLIVFFEPHTFTWRNRDAVAQYDSVFKDVDYVALFKPETQGATTHQQLSHEEIFARVQASGVATTAIHNQQEGLAYLKETATPGDVILLLTSGNMDQLVSEIPRFVDSMFPR